MSWDTPFLLDKLLLSPMGLIPIQSESPFLSGPQLVLSAKDCAFQTLSSSLVPPVAWPLLWPSHMCLLQFLLIPSEMW